jgi:hypothetical protein
MIVNKTLHIGTSPAKLIFGFVLILECHSASKGKVGAQ